MFCVKDFIGLSCVALSLGGIVSPPTGFEWYMKSVTHSLHYGLSSFIPAGFVAQTVLSVL